MVTGLECPFGVWLMCPCHSYLINNYCATPWVGGESETRTLHGGYTA